LDDQLYVAVAPGASVVVKPLPPSTTVTGSETVLLVLLTTTAVEWSGFTNAEVCTGLSVASLREPFEAMRTAPGFTNLAK
jgi:hypothetical protein